MITKKPRGVLFDRALLSLSGSKDPTDFFILRQAFEGLSVTGATGSGKTSTLLRAFATALLNKQGLRPEERVGMIVFLYKKGDAEDWQRWAFDQDRGDDLIHIEAHHANVFNLLAQYQDSEPMNAVNALMNISQIALGNGDHRESEGFWETAKRTRLDRLIRLCQTAGEPLNPATLYRIHASAPADREQLADPEFRNASFCWQMLEKAVQRVGEQDRDFKLAEDYFLREMPMLADRTSSSILAMVSGILEPFVSSAMLNRMFCGGSTLQLEQAFTGKIILLDIPVQIHETAGKLAQCLFKYAFQKAVEARDLRQYPNPLFFILDEAQAYLTPHDYGFLATCRSSRAGNILLSQNISNYYAALGGGPKAEAQVNSLLALCNTKVFLANNDHVTNEWAAKTIGMGIKRLNSFNVSRDSESAGSSQHIQYQVEPTEFTMLRTGGILNDFEVDAIIAGTGRVFSNGKNFLRTAFLQPFAH